MNLNQKIIELYKEGKEVSEIIVELNTTYKRVIKIINNYKENEAFKDERGE